MSFLVCTYGQIACSRVCTKCWILEKVLKFAQRFPGLEKVWKMEITSGKMVKSVEFFFESYNECFTLNFFFRFGQILIDLARMFEKKSFVPAIFKVVIDHQFDNRECGKREYCFEKSLEFWIHYSFYPAVAISWLCIWNFINSLCSMVLVMSYYSLYLEQYTSSITPGGQITVFQKTQALYYIFFMKWTQDNSPFQWLGQLLFIAGTWKLF